MAISNFSYKKANKIKAIKTVYYNSKHKLLLKHFYNFIYLIIIDKKSNSVTQTYLKISDNLNIINLK